MNGHAFLLDLLLILLAARIFAEVAVRLRAPAVVGELLAGVLLGPSLLNWVQPDELLHLLAQIGVIMLLFGIGLETDVHQLIRSGRKAMTVALGGFVAPFVLGAGLAWLLFDASTLVALFIGGTLTATSIGITVRVLSEARRQHKPEGQIVLGAAVVDDLLGVLLLALLFEFTLDGGISLGNASRVLLFLCVFFVLAPVVARLLSRVIQHFDRVSAIPGLVPTTMVSLVLLSAWLAHAMGAPELLGGFAAGLALSRRFILPLGAFLHSDPQFSHRVIHEMRPIIHLFTPIFFVMVGVSLDLREVDWGSAYIWLLSATLLVAAILGKVVGVLLLRETWPMRAVIATAMIPRGEVGLVFAELGRASGVFDQSVYAALIIVIAITTLLAPFGMQYFYRRYAYKVGDQWLLRNLAQEETAQDERQPPG